MTQAVKHLPAVQEMPFLFLGWEDPLEEKVAIHSRIGESHGQRSLAGYSPRGHTELDMTELMHKRLHPYNLIYP